MALLAAHTWAQTDNQVRASEQSNSADSSSVSSAVVDQVDGAAKQADTKQQPATDAKAKSKAKSKAKAKVKVFKPSEQISEDVSVPFPIDI